MDKNLLVSGLVIATIGAILHAWTMIEPRIWIGRKRQHDAKVNSLLTALEEGKKFFPADSHDAIEYANKFHMLYHDDLKERTTRKLGWVGAIFLSFGFLLQLIGTLLQG